MKEVKFATVHLQGFREGASDEKAHDNEGEVTIDKVADFDECESRWPYVEYFMFECDL